MNRIIICLLALVAFGCECIEKPREITCRDGWGHMTVHHYTNRCEQKDNVTYHDYGSETGDCSCTYVHRASRCEP